MLRDAITAGDTELIRGIVRGQLAHITDTKSNEASLSIAENYSNLKSAGCAIIEIGIVANATGNVDLLKICEENVSKFPKKFEGWREASDALGGMKSEIEALAKWRSPVSDDYFDRFLAAPDLNYGEINEWYSAWATRSLQGILARTIARFQPESKKKLYALLGEQKTSLSKKRTIIHSMRYDPDESARDLLRILAEVGIEVISKEAKDSLRVWEAELELFQKEQKAD